MNEMQSRRLEAFFKSRQAPAVLKHSILSSYLPPFVQKTGQRSRVAFVDGYAGCGRYETGESGSAALVLATARRMSTAAHPRDLDCYFVEENRLMYDRLVSVIEEEGNGLEVWHRRGPVETFLPEILNLVEQLPTLFFLDPCGLIVPLDDIAPVLERPWRRFLDPATEVLLNFSALGLRRTAGHLTSPTPNPATLSRMDAVCGGDWWREDWLHALPDKTAAEQAVVHGYQRRLSEAAGGAGGWVISVRRRDGVTPIYYLIFLSHHPHGLALFGESASTGFEKWRRRVMEIEYEDEPDLAGSWETHFEETEKQLQTGWVTSIATNLRHELAKGSAFRIADRYGEIFGGFPAMTRDKHLRAAWKSLHEDGLTEAGPVGDMLIMKTITPKR